MLDRDYYEHYGMRRGCLGPTGTLLEYKNMGLTIALTITALNFLLKQGMGTAALYVLEKNSPSPDLALRIGFRIAKHWLLMNKDFPAAPLQPRED